MISDDGRHASERVGVPLLSWRDYLAPRAVLQERRGEERKGQDRTGQDRTDADGKGSFAETTNAMLEAALNILPNTVYGGRIVFLIAQGWGP
jgi:hypothetical protein